MVLDISNLIYAIFSGTKLIFNVFARIIFRKINNLNRRKPNMFNSAFLCFNILFVIGKLTDVSTIWKIAF